MYIIWAISAPQTSVNINVRDSMNDWLAVIDLLLTLSVANIWINLSHVFYILSMVNNIH